MEQKNIYLDYAATTPMDKRVFSAMKPYFSLLFGNAGSLHSFGQEAMSAVDSAREKIAKAIHADFRQVIFTGSATEANCLVILNSLNLSLGEGITPKILISAIEHDSVYQSAKSLEKRGCEVVIIPVNAKGILDVKKLKESLDERTVLVSVMMGNNEVGTIQDVPQISEIIRDFRNEKSKLNSPVGGRNSKIQWPWPLLHTDAVQAFQFLDCDVEALGVDFLTLSGHKIGGPKGIGALYVRDPKKLFPTIIGGGQEFGLRSGTENVPSIVGLGKAVELAEKERDERKKYILSLREYFVRELKKIYPQVKLHGDEKNTLPHIVNAQFPGISAEMFLVALDSEGIAVSTGSACSARGAKLSHVLSAMKLPVSAIRESIRFSFGTETTKQELQEAIVILKKLTKNLSK